MSWVVFSLGESIRFGSLKFITDHFVDMSLSPMGDGSGATVMGSTRGGTQSSLWATTEDTVEEFHTASDGEGRIDLPSPQRHDTGASTAPAITIPWPEATPTTQAMTTIILW
jgi:hypothetical protein